MASGCDKLAHLKPDERARFAKRTARAKKSNPLTCHRRIQEVDPDLAAWVTDFIWLREHGLMPRAGGYKDQDARWIHAMNVIRPLWPKPELPELLR